MNANDLLHTLLKKVTDSEVSPVAIHADDPLTYIIYPINQIGSSTGYIVKRINSDATTTLIES
jgi:DNA topoisomerase VI subunit A